MPKGKAVFSIICERIPSNIMCFWKRVVRSIIVRAEAKRSASTANGGWKRNVSLPHPQYIYYCLGERSETFRFQQPMEEGSETSRFEQPMEEGSETSRFQQPMGVRSETSRFQQPMGEGSETSRFHAHNIYIAVWVKEAKRFASTNQWRKEAKRFASNNQWRKEAKRLASTPTIYVLLFG